MMQQDGALNSIKTVVSSVHSCFLVAAMRTHAFVRLVQLSAHCCCFRLLYFIVLYLKYGANIVAVFVIYSLSCTKLKYTIPLQFLTSVNSLCMHLHCPTHTLPHHPRTHLTPQLTPTKVQWNRGDADSVPAISSAAWTKRPPLVPDCCTAACARKKR